MWLILAFLAVPLLGLAGWRAYDAYREPVIDETGVVTVISLKGGYTGKYGSGRFAHDVRFDSGTEATMFFGQIFPRGARIWVSYRRFPKTSQVQVKFYVRQKDPKP